MKTRVRRYGKWSNRAFRAWHTAQAAWAMARIFVLFSRHDRMWLLFAWEKMPLDERAAFASEVGRAIKKAWTVQELKPEAEKHKETER